MNYFNRHENMSIETLQKIGKVINEVQFKQKKSFTFVNYLYGLYDGFNYTNAIKENALYSKVMESDPQTFQVLNEVLDEINQYPQLEEHPMGF